MTKKRFTIKPQDDYFGITDNYTADKVNVINGIRTEIEAEWLCDLMNNLNDENEQLKQSIYIMGGKLQGLWANYYENRWGIWSEAVEDIANELGFKIHHVYDVPISDSESKKERVEGVKKITRILEENQRLQKENKILYDENIQLRHKLLHFIQLKDDVKYLEEKGVFKNNDGDVE